MKQHYLWRPNNIHDPIILENMVAKGGEGSIYTIRERSSLCAKVYHRGCIRLDTQRKLELMLQKDGLQLNANGVCWPIGLLFDEGNNFHGYVMNRVSDPAKTLLTLMRPPLRKQFIPTWDRESLCLLALRFLDIMESLHEQDILIGDINEHNILFTPDPNQIYLVDTDSFQIGNYLCPVGQIHYTPPELIGMNFTQVKREVKHELFSLAVLLFKIFMLGQSPYAAVGGQSPEKNILEGIFPYPLSVDEDQGVPKGRWEALWRSLDFDIKELFVNTFREKERPTIDIWRRAIEGYRNSILSEKVMGSMEPENLKIIMAGRASKIDDGRKRGTGLIENIWDTNPHPQCIGVLELSTRAVKMMLGKTNSLLTGFKWEYFQNDAVLTNTGHYIDDRNIIPLDDFQKYVFPVIENMVKTAKKLRVDRLYCIATAAYRSAKNREDILKLLKESLDLNVKILDRREEAHATVDGFIWSVQHSLPEGKYILLDQGGGSTEISVFTPNGEIIGSACIPIGTTSAINTMFVNSYVDTALDAVLLEGRKAPRQIINRNIREIRKLGPFTDIIGVGSAITKATKKKNNRQQHRTRLNQERLQQILEQTKIELLKGASTPEELAQHIQNLTHRRAHKKDVLAETLVIHLGISMVSELLTRFDSQSLVVNGAALRYGVFYQQMRELFPGYEQDPTRWQTKLRMTYKGVTEGDIIEGTVQNIAEFGVFVKLGSVDGLIHISKFKEMGIQMQHAFTRNQTVRVYVEKVTPPNGSKKARFELGLRDETGNSLLPS